LRRLRVRVLDLDPGLARPGSIDRAKPLGHDALGGQLFDCPLGERRLATRKKGLHEAIAEVPQNSPASRQFFKVRDGLFQLFQRHHCEWLDYPPAVRLPPRNPPRRGRAGAGAAGFPRRNPVAQPHWIPPRARLTKNRQACIPRHLKKEAANRGGLVGSSQWRRYAICRPGSPSFSYQVLQNRCDHDSLTRLRAASSVT
jgi:hypothetical protein